jgi:hypothetical protein
MITVEAWVEGTSPILLHRFSGSGEIEKKTRRVHIATEDPRTLCEASVYRDDEGGLCLPGSAFARLIREAGGAHKQRGSRKTLKYIVPAAMIVTDELAPLFLTDRLTRASEFEIDARPVTIPATKGRIMRYRARLNAWSTKVYLRINDNILDEATIRMLLGEGVQQQGLGDFRPEKGGPFGTADVVGWVIVSDRVVIPPRATRTNGKATSAQV